MKEGAFVKYRGKEFSASNNRGVVTAFSRDLADVKEYGFEECEPFDMPGYGRVLCKKKVHLSEVDEYYMIGLNAIYKGFEGDIGRPDKDNNVVIGFGWCHMTPDEAERLGMEIGYGEYYKRVPIEELDIFEERDDYDIPKLLSLYEKAK